MTSQKPLTLLIVDDVEEVRLMLKDLLDEGLKTRLGRPCKIRTAANGAEMALEISRHKPDWVLLDEVFPHERSEDLVEQVSKNGIPILLMTGLESLFDSESQQQLPVGVQGRIKKPANETDTEIFLDEVEEIITGP